MMLLFSIGLAVWVIGIPLTALLVKFCIKDNRDKWDRGWTAVCILWWLFGAAVACILIDNAIKQRCIR